MPNWVRNIVTVSKDTMNKLKEKYFSDGILDFEKIIPMPETLNLADGTITEISIYYAIQQKNNEEKDKIIELLKQKEDYIYKNYWERIKHFKEYKKFKDLEQYAKKFVPDEEARKLKISTFEELGNTYIDNIKKYGSATWYDWRIENWGTKWGVSEFVANETTMIFDTAWSTPDLIFEKISEELPNDKIKIKYADECISENNGILIYKDGLIDSKEELGRKFARNVWKEEINKENEKDILDSLGD